MSVFTVHCCTYRSKCIAVTPCWPFSHALIAALYVIMPVFRFQCFISRSKLTAVIHCWPFSHARMVALYVIALVLTFHCCIFRSKLTDVVHCWHFSHVLMAATACDRIGLNVHFPQQAHRCDPLLALLECADGGIVCRSSCL